MRPTLFHDRVSGRLATGDVDVMLEGPTRDCLHISSCQRIVYRQCFLEVPPSPLVFHDEIFRFKFINRQKNFVFTVSRILIHGTGVRSRLSFGQEQNLYGRRTTGLNLLNQAANDVTVAG